jgi:hypothetical protein
MLPMALLLPRLIAGRTVKKQNPPGSRNSSDGSACPERDADVAPSKGTSLTPISLPLRVILSSICGGTQLAWRSIGRRILRLATAVGHHVRDVPARSAMPSQDPRLADTFPIAQDLPRSETMALPTKKRRLDDRR